METMGGSRIYKTSGQPQRVGANLLFGQIFPKTAWNGEKWNGGYVQNFTMQIRPLETVFHLIVKIIN